MNKWQFCFKLDKGKTYRFRYVYRGEDAVREAVLTWRGETTGWNHEPVLVMQQDDTLTLPGRVQILQIDEQDAPAEVAR